MLFCFVALVSCKKEPTISAEEQTKKDDKLITDFAAKNNLTLTKHSSGVYYQIISQGSGVSAVGSSTITANYEGRLLDGTVFDKTTTKPLVFSLRDVINGWQAGIQLVQKGGKIRLLVPSRLAYGGHPPTSAIPMYAVLDFTIEVVDIQ